MPTTSSENSAFCTYHVAPHRSHQAGNCDPIRASKRRTAHSFGTGAGLEGSSSSSQHPSSTDHGNTTLLPEPELAVRRQGQEFGSERQILGNRAGTERDFQIIRMCMYVHTGFRGSHTLCLSMHCTEGLFSLSLYFFVAAAGIMLLETVSLFRHTTETN